MAMQVLCSKSPSYCSLAAFFVMPLTVVIHYLLRGERGRVLGAFVGKGRFRFQLVLVFSKAWVYSWLVPQFPQMEGAGARLGDLQLAFV